MYYLLSPVLSLFQNGSTSLLSELSLQNDVSSEMQHEEEEVSSNAEWRSQEKHIFILSSAGKPIYSR